MSFSLHKKIPGSLGRAGVIHTPHGDIQTPAFAVVGTQATVKALTPDMVKTMGAQVVLANTYHLYLEPGDEIIKNAGGFGPFMGWQGPTITDSGGFQVFSLGAAFGEHVSKVATQTQNQSVKNPEGGTKNNERLARVDDQGVTFRSHRDGSTHRFTPERSMEIQWNLGADIIFAFDECTSPQASYEYQKTAMDRTHTWALQSLIRHNELDTEKKQMLLGVVQGGQSEDLRRESARTLASLQTESGDMFDGFGIGGSFTKEDLGTAVKWVNEELPEEKPRHLLGIGEPGDVLLGIEHGCDLFDCVAPTRIARNGTIYTHSGTYSITNAQYRTDMQPLEPGCTCYTCTHFTRAYVAHLFHAKEMLAGTLASIHNVHFTVQLVDGAREAIHNDTFFEYKKKFMDAYYAE